MARQGRARRGTAGEATSGGNGAARQGIAGAASWGELRQGQAGTGPATQAWKRLVRSACLGLAMQANTFTSNT